MRISREILGKPWTAAWVRCPEGPECDFGVFHFRKKLHFEKVPKSFVLHISADNRYRFFVNGRSVCRGPCRGDMNRWFFETVDIADFLRAGENVLAAVVWNFGVLRPLAQVSFQTRFVVQSNSGKERRADTRSGSGWKSFYNRAYDPYLAGGDTAHLAVGPGERVEGSFYPWGWEKEGFDDAGWSGVRDTFPRALPRAEHSWGSVSYLVPRPIPMMEENPQFFKRVASAEGIEVTEEFLSGKSELSIPPDSDISVILDQSVLTTAYPEIEVSGGKGASIVLCYAEALRRDGDKGNRGEVEGKEISGLSDYFLPDGGENRVFGPLWWRAFRYVRMRIVTGAEPLRIKRFSSSYTGYPFKEKASFKSDDPELKDIWDICWRTARLCAHETYLDCPYYEQLQYVGDTRIQALISLYVSGDDRLMRKAIRQFGDSLLPDGLTVSQYPSFYIQVIPPYSLIWINMLSDYRWFRDDHAFVRGFLPVSRHILNWFEERLDGRTGLLGPLPWWNFVDWSYEGGVPPGAKEGNSSVVSLQFVDSLLDASEMEKEAGNSYYAARYRKLAAGIKKRVLEQCWDERKGLLSDTPSRKYFSQHANVLAVLTDTIPRKKQEAVIEKVLEERSLVQCTSYFQFYLHQAVRKAGMGDLYVSLLEAWRKMLEMGLTTCSEKPEPSRSDCHAWSAHPDVSLLAIVCGITPAKPGFRSVRIEPHPGPLKWIEGAMPHPSGSIGVKIRRVSECRISAEIILPAGVDGSFVYGKTSVPLKPGKQVINGVKQSC